MSQAIYKLKISPQLKEHLRPNAPKEKKIAMIDGSFPMPLHEQCTIFTYFLSDNDPEIATLAKNELCNIPQQVLSSLLSQDLHPKTLVFFSTLYREKSDILEKILRNPYCPNSLFIELAENAKDNILALIINHQERHFQAPEIIDALKKNTHIQSFEIEKIVSFLRINGVYIQGESPELTHDEVQQILAMEDSLSFDLPKELLEDNDNVHIKISDSDAVDDELLSVYQKIQKMNIAQKIKIALKGNKEARSILIKDSNKIVSSAVVKSPKITDNEVLAIAALKSVNDEVIRIISTKPQWTKLYAMQFTLCTNPKTPFKTAMTFLKNLNINDLQKISKNKNVPPQISKIAKQLFASRRS